MRRRCCPITLVVQALVLGVIMLMPEPTEAAVQCASSNIFLGDQCLSFVDSSATWENARLNCGQRTNQYLASLDRESSDAVVTHLTQIASEHNWWVGGTDAKSYGNWKWLDGIAVDVNWAPGQPINEDGHCLAVNKTGFYPHPCGSSLFSICAVVKSGWCPPVRRHCPVSTGPPVCGISDFNCPGSEKCCYDVCLRRNTCKNAQGV